MQIIAEEIAPDICGNDENCLEGFSRASSLSPEIQFLRAAQGKVSSKPAAPPETVLFPGRHVHETW
jgi:hypothetical protein